MLACYVAGKISDATPEKVRENINRLKGLTLQCIIRGLSPYPTAYTEEWETALGLSPSNYYDLDNVWLVRADVMVVVPEGREASVGVTQEIALATASGIPVCIGIDGLDEWLASQPSEPL